MDRDEFEVDGMNSGRHGAGTIEELAAKEFKQIGNGWTTGWPAPFGKRQKIAGAAETVSVQRSQEKQAISGDLKLGQTIDSVRIADLAFSNADEGFFVAVIAFNFPAIDVSLKEKFQRESQVGANEECGIAVEEFGTFAETIAEGFNNDETKRAIGTGFSPEDLVGDFDPEVPELPGSEGADFKERNGLIGENFLGSWRQLPEAAGAALTGSRGIQRQTEFSVFANAAEQDRIVRQTRKDRLISVGAIDRHKQRPLGGGGTLIESVAHLLDDVSAGNRQGAQFALLLVIRPFGFGGIFLWLWWKCSRLETHGQSARRAGLSRVNHQRGLDKTQTGNQIGVKLG